MKSLFRIIAFVLSKSLFVISVFFILAVGYQLVLSDEIDNIYSSGESMLPTLPDGGWHKRNISKKPVVGDIVDMTCLSSKCIQTVEPDVTSTIHRLTAIESNGCMHIEGDNQPIAWDTRDYGCLMPDEVRINGVIVDVIDK